MGRERMAAEGKKIIFESSNISGACYCRSGRCAGHTTFADLTPLAATMIMEPRGVKMPPFVS